MKISMNGKMVDESDAKISIFDRGFLYGDGIFETVPVSKGEPIWLSEHIDRLLDGSSKMLIKLLRTKEELMQFCNEVVEENHQYDSEKIKIILSRGASGYSANIEDLNKCEPNLVIYTMENKLPVLEDIKQKGLNIMTTDQIRPYPKIKSTSYIASILGNIYAKEKGFDDILVFRKSIKSYRQRYCPENSFIGSGNGRNIVENVIQKRKAVCKKSLIVIAIRALS